MSFSINNNIQIFSLSLSKIAPRVKPVLYLITAIALAVLLYKYAPSLYSYWKNHSATPIQPQPSENGNGQTDNTQTPVVAPEPPVEIDGVASQARRTSLVFPEVIPPAGVATLPSEQKVDEDIFEAPHTDPIDPSPLVASLNNPPLERKVPAVTWGTLVANSKAFTSKHPHQVASKANTIEIFATTDVLKAAVTANANNTRPFISRHVITYMEKWLAFKREHGSATEQSLYAEMDVPALLDRLLSKRPIVFFNPDDTHMLRDGKKGRGGFETIGTDKEEAPLLLTDYLSYDEMRIATFLSVACPTFFINDGDRKNIGKPGEPGTFITKGVSMAMVGTRFEKPGYMEWNHCIIDANQNTEANGYGENADPTNPKTIELGLAKELYSVRYFPAYEEAHTVAESEKHLPLEQQQYIAISNEGYLNAYVFKEHLKLKLEGFLLDADRRAGEANTKAYLHIVGLGLGAWGIHPSQLELSFAAYAELIQKHNLQHIGDIDFAYMRKKEELCGGVENNEFITDGSGNQIKIHYSTRNPGTPLPLEEDKLLVAMYAWDSNSYPGNEYWMGALAASGDPAAACASQISELQNPEINSENLRGENVLIY